MAKRAATGGGDGRDAATKGELDDFFSAQREEVTKLASGAVERANEKLKQGFLVSQRAQLERYHDVLSLWRRQLNSLNLELPNSRVIKPSKRSRLRQSVETLPGPPLRLSRSMNCVGVGVAHPASTSSVLAQQLRFHWQMLRKPRTNGFRDLITPMNLGVLRDLSQVDVGAWFL